MIYTNFKRIISTILAVLLAFSSVGCSDAKSYDSVEIAEEILEVAAFSEMKELSGSSLPSYFIFGDGSVKRYNVWVSANGESADTLACFQAKDSEQRSTAIAGIKQHLTFYSQSFASTMEYQKIEKRLLVEVGDVIVLVICNDTAPVWDYLSGIGAKEVI